MKIIWAMVALCGLASACGGYPSDDDMRAKAATLCTDWREGHVDALYERAHPELKKEITLEKWTGLFELRANVSGACQDVARVDGTSRGVATPVGRYIVISGTLRYERGEAPFELKYGKCDRGWCVFGVTLADEPKPPAQDEVAALSRAMAEKLVHGNTDGLWASFLPRMQKSFGSKETFATHVESVAQLCPNATISEPVIEATKPDDQDGLPISRAVVSITCEGGSKKLELVWKWVLNVWILSNYKFEA